MYIAFLAQPPILLNINATAKPVIAASPILLLPSSKASGIIDSANITRIAPAANDIAIDIIAGLVFDKTASMYFLVRPFSFIPWVEAKPSGKFEMKIAAIRTIFTAPPLTSEIPRAMFSGMLSIIEPIIEPTSNDKPEAFLPPPAFSPCDLFLFLTTDELPQP